MQKQIIVILIVLVLLSVVIGGMYYYLDKNKQRVFYNGHPVDKHLGRVNISTLDKIYPKEYNP
jgi:uncharacterized protein YneF (UPF0154 family)